MDSILNNSAALSALQSLNMTQQNLKTVQGEVSSGLAVASAADNASYWSIATQLQANSTMISAANSSISQSQSILDVASTAIKSIITTINAIQTTLTQATNPGANLTNIATTLGTYGSQLTDAVNGAYFNGINILDGTQQANSNTAINFVSGFYASPTTPSSQPTGLNLNGYGTTTISLTLQTAYSPSGSNSAYSSGSGSLLVAQGTATGGGGTYDLTQFGASGTNAITTSTTQATIEDALTAVNTVLTNITNYAASIGATQDRLSSISNLNSALTTNYANGVSGLVDADMNTASTRLQALQTQQQLGIQSLSIANQNAQLILKLFP